MKYTRFEELPVWKDAIELAVRVFALTSKPVFRRYRGIKDQIETRGGIDLKQHRRGL